MSWFGKIVGGAIGFAVGGPLGAAVGAGLGHGLDSLIEEEDKNQQSAPAPTSVPANEPSIPDLLPMSFATATDAIGVGYRIQFQTQLPRRAVAAVSVLDEDGTFLPGAPGFQDESGDFVTAVPIENLECRIYVPYGAVRTRRPGTHILRVAVGGANDENEDLRYLGQGLAEIHLPGYQPWNPVGFLSPLVDLCMYVVRADEKVLPEEVRQVKKYMTELFELGPQDMPALRDEMKAAPRRSIHEAVESVWFRMPRLEPIQLLAILADVSACDGEIHPKEIEVIRQVAAALGAPPEAWDDIRRTLRLFPGPVGGNEAAAGVFPEPIDPYEVLGVSPDASWPEILAAYRKLAAQYHPDNVAHLPKEFQELAHQKMVEINAAYEMLRNRR